MDRLEEELMEALVEAISKCAPSEAQSLREKLTVLRIVRRLEEKKRAIWQVPQFWTVLLLLLAIVGAILGIDLSRFVGGP